MTPAQLDLARQLAALPGFRWDVGMTDDRGVRVYRRPSGVHGVDADAIDADDQGWNMFDAFEGDHDTALPDLTDDATGGVLLGWLAAMDQWPNIEHIAGGWSIAHGRTGHTYPGATLAEACARALVAVGRCA